MKKQKEKTIIDHLKIVYPNKDSVEYLVDIDYKFSKIEVEYIKENNINLYALLRLKEI